jgi:DedD protein
LKDEPRYTSTVERQLKERLIGAAVLVAAAVILVPEMFSGPRESVVPETDAVRPTANQIKTYRVELQSSPTAAALESQVEPPAERPLDETQAMQTNPDVAKTAPDSPEQKPRAMVTQPPMQGAVVPAPPAKPETARPVSTVATSNKLISDGWVVQVGSFSVQGTAQQIAAKLKGQGFPAFVEPVQVNGKTLYRVRVGTMANRASADAALQKLHGSYPGASVIAPGR